MEHRTLDIEKPSTWDGRTAVILAHGAGQGKDSPFMVYFHNELAKCGFLSVKFNFDYIDTGRRMPDPQPKLQARYRSVVEDILREYKPGRVIIGGKSMGGRVASYIAADTAGVKGLVFLGYPLHPPGKPEQLRDAHLYGLKVPMLFISGTKDPFADGDRLDKVVRKIGGNATLKRIERGDHSLKRNRGDQESLRTAVDWISEWVAGLR